MNRRLGFSLFICLFAAYIFSSTLIVGGCGGGGGDGGILPALSSTPTPLATGAFIKTESLGSDTGWGAPFSDSFNSHEQHLFFAWDINGSGYIKSLSFRYMLDELVSTNCPDITIKMGHTSLSALTTTFANNVEQGRGSLEAVFTGSLTIPAGSAGDYFTISLDTPFHYNGVDNLVVEFINSALCDNTIDIVTTSTVYTNVTLWDSNEASVTGTLYHTYPNAKFTFVGGDNEQNFGGASNVIWPFSSSTPRTQNLYLASEIDGSGPITGLAFQMNAVSTAETYTATVRMGHTTLAALGTTYADNYDAGAPVTVANAVTFGIPAGIPAGEWFWVPLPDSTFTYNGTDNLIVDVVTTAGSGDTNLRYTNIPNRRAYNINNADPVAASVDSVAVHIKFRFNGGTMDVMTSGTTFDVPFFGIDDTVLQVIYGANDLGTKAQIDKVAFRLISNSVAEEYTGFSVVMGHTNNTTLSMTLAENMDDPTNVFSGTVNIPAGLRGGDWVEIPVSGFTYNPLKNLTIQVTTNKGTLNNTNPIFAGNRAISGAGAASIGSPTFDMGTGAGSAALKLSYTKY